MNPRDKNEGNCQSLSYNFGSRHLARIIIKMVMNTKTQMRDKTANATQDKLKFER